MEVLCQPASAIHRRRSAGRYDCFAAPPMNGAQVPYAEAEPMYLRALALAELQHMEDEVAHGPP